MITRLAPTAVPLVPKAGIDGKGSEAMKFLGLALETDSEHRLTTLLIAMINSGELPKSASTKH